jgi:hypothetical protein
LIVGRVEGVKDSVEMDLHARDVCVLEPLVDRVQRAADSAVRIVPHESDAHLEVSVYRLCLDIVRL